MKLNGIKYVAIHGNVKGKVHAISNFTLLELHSRKVVLYTVDF